MTNETIHENIKRGTIEMLLLALLKESDMYGYQLAQELEGRSAGHYVFRESSIYPTLYRLTGKGLISGEKRPYGSRRFRVYYSVQPKGLEYLETTKREFLDLYNGILMVLESTGDILAQNEEKINTNSN